MDMRELYHKHNIKNANEQSRYLYKEYEQLSESEINEIIDIVMEDCQEYEDHNIDALLHLALYSYHCGDYLPNRLYDYLIENHIFYYSELYLRATEKISNRLISIIEHETDTEHTNLILYAISAICCESSKIFLVKSSQEPLPNWAKRLYVLPINYAEGYGWTVDHENHIKSLISDEVIAFEPCDIDKKHPWIPLKPLDEVCAFCTLPLVMIYNKDKPLATCMNCSGYQTIYIKYNHDIVYWHPKNKKSDFLLKNTKFTDPNVIIDYCNVIAKDFFTNALQPTNETRKPTYNAHNFNVDISVELLGGLPTTISDIQYPHCPDCSEIMPFVGQYQGDAEGLVYFFACDKCCVVASNYDQT